MPIYDEDEDDENEDAVKASPVITNQPTSGNHSRRPSPKPAAESQELLIDLETNPDNATPSDVSLPSQHSAASTATLNTGPRGSNVSDMSAISPSREETSSPLESPSPTWAPALPGREYCSWRWTPHS